MILAVQAAVAAAAAAIVPPQFLVKGVVMVQMALMVTVQEVLVKGRQQKSSAQANFMQVAVAAVAVKMRALNFLLAARVAQAAAVKAVARMG